MMEYLKQAKPRESRQNDQLIETVSSIIRNVRNEGDQALLGYNKEFGPSNREILKVSGEELREAYLKVPKNEIDDINSAAKNIRAFAEAQMKTILPLDNFQPEAGISLGHRVIPISECCCYVPGGAYPLYSTALMLIIPAKTAGVKRVAACTPCIAGTDKVDPRTLVAMDIAGADEIYATGGAQSIAAFTYGTEQVKPVDLIVGPGNQYVTEAKRQCYGQVGIDFLAGPSEVMILADATACPKIVAADLLAQSEHDELAKGILITTDKKLAKSVILSVEKQLKELSSREKAASSWRNYGEVILAPNIEEAIDLVNDYAPEHLEVIHKDCDEIIPSLINYGALFIGRYSAEVFGDYAAGPNHTLPTMRAARYTGGVYVGTFLKICTHQHMNKEAMQNIAPLVDRLARGEGLNGHANAARIRLEEL